MKITPRSYQAECVQALYQYFAEKEGNPVCALPTGTGKSICIALFIESVLKNWPKQRVLVLTHVKELIKQNYAKLLDVWPGAPAGVNSAGLNQRDYYHSIVFAGIGSVYKSASQFGHIDLIIIDEAHLVSPRDATMYQTFISGLQALNPSLKVIGFTATPWRLGHGHIAQGDDALFTDVCFDITGMEAFNRLIAEGYLAPLVPKQTTLQLNLDGVHMRGGDFIQKELQHAVDVDRTTLAAIREALETGHDRHHWLIFASGIDHADHIAQMMEELGETCLPVHSKMPSKKRDENIRRFQAGEVRAVVNNNVLTTGFDFPEIDLILMLRPTASPVLWVQMLGRGTRPAPGKENCLVLDFAGNTKRLGPINDPVIPNRKGKSTGDAPVKTCEHCFTLNHASVRFCVTCGAEFHFQTKLKQAASTEELIKGELPQVEVFTVDHVTYRQYDKIDRPPSIKVTYYCGLQSFSEYVCFEHGGYAARRARVWWRDRAKDAGLPSGKDSVPETTAQALFLIEELPVPTHLRVWINKKYPEIMQQCFDGTSFGQHAPEDINPSTEVLDTNPRRASELSGTAIEDDDIPF